MQIHVHSLPFLVIFMFMQFRVYVLMCRFYIIFPISMCMFMNYDYDLVQQ